ncbi:ATP binding protein [Rutstroemia sp. NJR-2017a WRK4]|nr:ATP binding protein [Rutstroemia sp. NJR-2017a WRK4]
MDTTEEVEIINSHPIKEGLVAFRLQFESSHLVLDLIGALQNFLAARILYSSIDRKTCLYTDLFSLGSKVGSRDFDIKSTIPLVELVYTIFNLILTTSPKQVTLPTTFEKAIFDIPLRSSSAS